MTRHHGGVDLDGLYDVAPNVVRLVGGYHDGQRVTIGNHGWPSLWRMPGAPPDIPLVGELWPSDMPGHPTYQRTDSVNDRGERAYRYIGEQ